MIYKLREWVREDDNAPYVKEEDRDALVEYLTEQEDWLYEDGANQNYSTYEKMEKNLTSKLSGFENRKSEHEKREKVKTIVEEAMKEYEKKLEDLKDSKPWITDSERKDVTDRMKEISDWLAK